MEPIFGEDNYIETSVAEGGPRGLVPRDMASFPVGTFAPPANIPLVDLKTLPDRIRESEAKKSRLSDLLRRAGIPSMNQNDPRYQHTRNPRWGYCWSYGTAACVVALREAMGLPYVKLTGFPNAYTIKNGVDEGAWGALSLEHIGKYGIPPDSHWPEFEQRMRPMSDPAWQEALKYRVTDGWMELASPVYDRDMSKHQALTLLINRIPISADMNDWGHNTMWCDVVDVYPNRDPQDLTRYGVRGRNSWGNSWGDLGFYVRKDRFSIPDNAVAPSVVIVN